MITKNNRGRIIPTVKVTFLLGFSWVSSFEALTYIFLAGRLCNCFSNKDPIEFPNVLNLEIYFSFGIIVSSFVSPPKTFSKDKLFSFSSNLTITAPIRPERFDAWIWGARNSAAAAELPFSKDAFRLPYAISLKNPLVPNIRTSPVWG